MIFNKPTSASVSQPSRSSHAHTHAAASLAYIAPIVSVGVAGNDRYQNFSKRGDWEDDNKTKVTNMSDPALTGRTQRQQIRIEDLIQKKGMR